MDASVVVKWALPILDNEDHADKALQILFLAKDSRVFVRQPPHWLAEAAAVIGRLSPETAVEDIKDLYEFNFEIVDSLDVYIRACEISKELNHHMFDTLYHAVAILGDAILVTADRKYFNKAEEYGKIVLLENFEI